MEDKREYSSGELYRIMVEVRSQVKSLEDQIEASEHSLRGRVDAVAVKASVLEERMAQMAMPSSLIVESISKAAVLEERLSVVKTHADKVPAMEEQLKQVTGANAVWRAALASGVVTSGILLIQYILTKSG